MEPAYAQWEEQYVETGQAVKSPGKHHVDQSLEWDSSSDRTKPAINPRPAPPFEKNEEIPKRYVFCSNYDQCLDLAISQHWASFTCEECSNYEFADCGIDTWLEDSARCWELIDALDEMQ
ncbi:MAG: hypothetical protein JSU72_09875 [Deltaproteobacteria bacterium]|nr:MAG: hypothetical protein JSU72_09875 [Deltaproteobacteria bacterium]